MTSIPKTPLFRSPFRRIEGSLDQWTNIGDENDLLKIGPEIGLSDSSKKKIWQALENWYRTAIHPFVSVCLRKQGRVVLHRSVGHIDGTWSPAGIANDGRVGSVDTPVCVFSASKALTAMLIHGLAEEQLLDLNKPVAHYLPKFAQKGKGGITLSDVLTHRSGFPRFPDHLPPETLFDFDAVVDVLCQLEIPSRLAKRTAYHALSGGHILAAVAREVSGKNMNQLLRKKIGVPLGLSSMRYGATINGRKKIAKNYDTSGGIPQPFAYVLENALGAPWKQVVEYSNRAEFLDAIIPSGNAIGNAADWCSFMEMLRCGGVLDEQRVFSEKTVQSATQLMTSTWFDQTLKIPLRFSQGMMLGNSPLGIFGQMTKHAFGHIGFANIFCWADTEREISVAILSTGKALFGGHMLELAKVLYTINAETQK